MNPAQKKEFAKEVFDTHPHYNTVWVNDHGHCYTEYGNARSTVDKSEQLLQVTRKEVMQLQPEGVVDWNDLTKALLIEELGRREIEFDEKAKKAELVALLEADDAEKANETEE